MGELKPLVDSGINLIDTLIGDEYRMCYEIACELYQDEQARQACCATLMIQYANIRKSNVKLKEAIDAMNAVSGASQERHVLDQFVRLYFAPLVKAYPKAGGYLSQLIRSNDYRDLDDAIAKMKDYMARNGFDFTLECRLTAIDGIDSIEG